MEDVTKRYRGGRGIDHVDLEVLSGEVFAFSGTERGGQDHDHPGAAGSDPTRLGDGAPLRIGPAPLDGVEIRRRLGYLPGDLALYAHLTGRELLTHFAHLRRGPTWSAIATLCDHFDLEVDKPIKALSKGNRQKVGLVQALMDSHRC